MGVRADYVAERQLNVIQAAQVPHFVAVAMHCWVQWMAQGEIGRGYPKSAIGFVSGGINCFDEFEEAADSYKARAVDGAIRSLDITPRTCINIIWLGQTIRFNRPEIDVDKEAVEAIKLVYRGLLIRGVA
jgi:hypothetical protein